MIANFFNRTVWILIIALLGSLFAAPFLTPVVDYAQSTGNSQNRVISSYMSEISNAWNRISSQYLTFRIPEFDLAGTAALALFGTVIVFGADFYIRRRTENVIKRLFTHNKDK